MALMVLCDDVGDVVDWNLCYIFARIMSHFAFVVDDVDVGDCDFC